MNHWFLVGRDIMWAIIGFFPVGSGILLGMSLFKDEDQGFDVLNLLFAAVVSQIALIGALYTGVIR